MEQTSATLYNFHAQSIDFITLSPLPCLKFCSTVSNDTLLFSRTTLPNSPPSEYKKLQKIMLSAGTNPETHGLNI